MDGGFALSEQLAEQHVKKVRPKALRDLLEHPAATFQE